MKIMGSLFSSLEEVKFMNAVLDYNDYSRSDNIRENLFQFLEKDAFQAIINECKEGDYLANAFVCAGACNHVDILQAFLNHGMNIDIRNQHGSTALSFSSFMGNKESVHFLLNLRANPDIQDKHGWTALTEAST